MKWGRGFAFDMLGKNWAEVKVKALTPFARWLMEIIMASRSFSARCGHITRRLNANQPLTGKLLELALNIIDEMNHRGAEVDAIREKIRTGAQLTDYESHIMIDAILVGKRLE